MVDWSIILCANNHKTGNGTGTGRRTITRHSHGALWQLVSTEPSKILPSQKSSRRRLNTASVSNSRQEATPASAEVGPSPSSTPSVSLRGDAESAEVSSSLSGQTIMDTHGSVVPSQSSLVGPRINKRRDRSPSETSDGRADTSRGNSSSDRGNSSSDRGNSSSDRGNPSTIRGNPSNNNRGVHTHGPEFESFVFSSGSGRHKKRCGIRTDLAPIPSPSITIVAWKR